MELKLEEAAYFDFVTHHPTTGAATDADSTPTAEVFEDATDTTVVALTVTKRTSKTGNYRVPVTAAAADGFEVGKTYNVVASATVNSIAAKGVVARFKVRTRGKDDLAYPATSGRSLAVDASGRLDVGSWLGSTPNALQSGRVDGYLGALASDTVTAAALASDAVTEIQSGLATSSALSALQSDVTTLLGRITSTLFSGITSLAQWLGAMAGKQTGNSTARTEIRATGAGSGTYDETTDSHEALRDRGDAAWTTATGFSTLDASGVRSALGVGSANLDTQLSALSSSLSTIAGYIDTEVAAIKAKTDNLPSDPADASDIAAAFSSLASTLSTIAGYIDTEVAAIKAKTDNLPAAPAATGDIPTTAQIADKVLGRNQAGGSDGGRTVTSALRALRNKVVIDGSTITVYEEDDVTVAWSGTVTRADLDALQTVDPS